MRRFAVYKGGLAPWEALDELIRSGVIRMRYEDNYNRYFACDETIQLPEWLEKAMEYANGGQLFADHRKVGEILSLIKLTTMSSAYYTLQKVLRSFGQAKAVDNLRFEEEVVIYQSDNLCFTITESKRENLTNWHVACTSHPERTFDSMILFPMLQRVVEWILDIEFAICRAYDEVKRLHSETK